MDLGYHIVIPTFVFLDANLSPLERLLYGVLSGTANQKGYCVATNEALASTLRSKADGVLKQVSVESLSRMLKHLEECGYIKREEINGNRAIVVIFQKQEVEVTLKTKPIAKKVEEAHDIAIRVLDYLSQASITRGYRKMAYKPTEANMKNLTARISENVEDSYERCVGVINAKFMDEYFTKNPQYLNPETLFRPSNFEKYVNQSSLIPNIEKKVVTKTGLSNVVSESVEEKEVAVY